MRVALADLIVAVPLLGALLVALLPLALRPRARAVALAFAALTGALAIGGALVAPAGEGALFAFDPLARAMVALSVAVFGLAFAAADTIDRRPHAFHAWMLALWSATLGVFLARGLGVFYICWEATLVPAFFLLGMWGGAGRARAATVLLVFTLVGSAFLLVAVLALPSLIGGGELSWAAFAAAGPKLDPTTQTLLLAALLVGIGVKLPIFPLHPWLPLAHVEAATPLTIVLSGILTKMAAAVLLRLAVALPEGFANLSPLLAALGTVALVHGAVLAARRTDLKAALAWSTLAHMGIVVVGVATRTAAGLEGATLELFAHGLTAAAAFYVVGRIYSRTGTRDVRALGGLLAARPGWALALAAALVSTMAFPGTAGFAAEAQIVVGVWQRFGLAVVAVAGGALLWSAVVVRLLVRLLGGPPGERVERLGRPVPLDRLALAVVLGATALIGLRPELALAPLRAPATAAAPAAAPTTIAEASAPGEPGE
ncbi:MAG: NADH-quinone oxidoreductase subunit M [bacterium]